MQQQAALERLYTSHARAVTSYARRRIDRAIADDVVDQALAWSSALAPLRTAA